MDREEQYKNMPTKRFADKMGWNYQYTRVWARRNGLRKSANYLRATRRENMRAYWRSRVPCAVDAQGLKHALCDAHAAEFLNACVGERRMLCRVKFAPIAIIEKDFPACGKCRAIFDARRAKPKNITVPGNSRRRKKK